VGQDRQRIDGAPRGMGLDSVELVMEFEDTFEVSIPDEDATQLLTPQSVIDYVYARVGVVRDEVCLEQRAFHRLRRASAIAFGIPQRSIRPSTRWEEILPKRRRRRAWKELHQATDIPYWPRLTLTGKFPEEVATVHGTATHLAMKRPAALLRPEEGCTRRDIERGVRRSVEEFTGASDFGLDDRFTTDLGID